MVVVVARLGGVDGQLQVVAAQPVTLRVAVRHDARLQQLVVAHLDACRQHAASAACTRVSSMYTTSSSKNPTVLGVLPNIDLW